MTAAHEARESLGARLRELRKGARLTGIRLAELAGWDNSKVSRLEHGRQTPSEDDIRTWCHFTNANLQIPDLIASARNIEAAYLEWRRIAALGHQRLQQRTIAVEAETELVRGYDPDLIPGLLQTRDYASLVLKACIDSIGGRDELAAAVDVRMERQQVLRTGIHRFHFIVAEQALYTTVGDDEVMIEQLGHLLDVMRLPRLVVGVIPRMGEFRCPTNNFLMYDRRLVQVETVSAELTITQPRELVLYEKTFQSLATQTLKGEAARNVIAAALEVRRARTDS